MLLCVLVGLSSIRKTLKAAKIYEAIAFGLLTIPLGLFVYAIWIDATSLTHFVIVNLMIVVGSIALVLHMYQENGKAATAEVTIIIAAIMLFMALTGARFGNGQISGGEWSSSTPPDGYYPR